jgi:hypothetical protein
VKTFFVFSLKSAILPPNCGRWANLRGEQGRTTLVLTKNKWAYTESIRYRPHTYAKPCGEPAESIGQGL